MAKKSGKGSSIKSFRAQKEQQNQQLYASSNDSLFGFLYFGIGVYLIYSLSYWAYRIRLHAIEEYGAVIHEFDPYFNYRATEVRTKINIVQHTECLLDRCDAFVALSLSLNYFFNFGRVQLYSPSALSLSSSLSISTSTNMVGKSSLRGLITWCGIRWDVRSVRRFIPECNSRPSLSRII